MTVTKILTNTAKNTVISPDLLIWKLSLTLKFPHKKIRYFIYGIFLQCTIGLNCFKTYWKKNMYAENKNLKVKSIPSWVS